MLTKKKRKNSTFLVHVLPAIIIFIAERELIVHVSLALWKPKERQKRERERVGMKVAGKVWCKNEIKTSITFSISSWHWVLRMFRKISEHQPKNVSHQFRKACKENTFGAKISIIPPFHSIGYASRYWDRFAYFTALIQTQLNGLVWTEKRELLADCVEQPLCHSGHWISVMRFRCYFSIVFSYSLRSFHFFFACSNFN